MAMKSMTSRDFNRDTGGAKKAASDGPVYITDRGRPSHVLLSFDDYQRLAGSEESIIDLLAEPPGAEDFNLNTPVSPDMARLAEFD